MKKSLHHFPGLRSIHADRFFTKKVFAMFGACHDGFVMQGIGCSDDDEVDLRVSDHFFPTLGVKGCSVFLGGGLQKDLATRAQRNHLRLMAGPDFSAIRRTNESCGTNDTRSKKRLGHASILSKGDDVSIIRLFKQLDHFRLVTSS